nr:hypothetical protein CFP56_75477 [Quercus suber]
MYIAKEIAANEEITRLNAMFKGMIRIQRRFSFYFFPEIRRKEDEAPFSISTKKAFPRNSRYQTILSQGREGQRRSSQEEEPFCPISHHYQTPVTPRNPVTLKEKEQRPAFTSLPPLVSQRNHYRFYFHFWIKSYILNCID